MFTSHNRSDMASESHPGVARQPLDSPGFGFFFAV